MGIQKLDKLPKEAVPLTRHSDIKLVLDTPKGMFYIFFFHLLMFSILFDSVFLCSCGSMSGERARNSEGK
jgi:hypothetical protein